MQIGLYFKLSAFLNIQWITVTFELDIYIIRNFSLYTKLQVVSTKRKAFIVWKRKKSAATILKRRLKFDDILVLFNLTLS